MVWEDQHDRESSNYMKYLTHVSSSSPSCRTLLISILYLSPISHKLACTSRGGFLLPALGRGNVAGCELSLRGRATGSTTAIYVTWVNCTVMIVIESGEATCKLPPLIWSWVLSLSDQKHNEPYSTCEYKKIPQPNRYKVQYSCIVQCCKNPHIWVAPA